MDESREPSPFAAFAMPKRSAAEVFQERRQHAAQTRRRMFGCVLSCLLGAVGAATCRAGFDGDLATVLAALAGSLAGAFAGVPSGFLLGSICFSVMSLSGNRGRTVLESEPVRRDPMTTLRGLLFAWSLIGVAIGASVGALYGAQRAGAAVQDDSLARGTMIYSLLGGAFAIAVWFRALRSR